MFRARRNMAQERWHPCRVVELRPTPDLDRRIERIEERLHRFERTGDGRARFLFMYWIFKNALRRNVAAGRFLDSEWAEVICCSMADFYLVADRAYIEGPESCPEPWRICFDRAFRGDTNLLQDMLLGMNAHINYDLPFCTHETLLAFEDVPVDESELGFDRNLKRRYYDFLLVNQIAWETIPLIQDESTWRYAKLLGIANRISFRQSRKVTQKLINDYRDRAWGHALLLAVARDDARPSLVRFLSDFALDAAQLVDRVTLRPLLLARAGRRLPSPPNDATVRLLVDNLGQRATTRVARRALVEYGPVAHAPLARLLEENDLSPKGREQVLAVIAAHPSTAGSAAIAREWDRVGAGLVARLLAAHRRAGVQVAFDRERVLSGLAETEARTRELAACARDLGAEGRGGLLGEALEARLEQAARSSADLAALLGPDSMRHAPTAPAEQRRSMRERLEELSRSADAWLRACALHKMGELGLLYADDPMLSTIEKVLYLKNVELFRDIPSEDLADMADLAEERRFPAGEELIREGAPGETLYVIVEGEVDVLADDGRRLARIGEAEVLGEMSLVSDEPASATCVAAGKGRALRIRRTDFQAFLLDYPEIAVGLLHVLAQRLRTMNRPGTG